MQQWFIKVAVIVLILSAFYQVFSPYRECMRSGIGNQVFCATITSW